MPETVRVGLVGGSGYGAVLLTHLAELATHGVEVVSIADPAPVAHEAAVEVPQFHSHRDMLAAGGLDAVVVAAPPYKHLPIARDAFAHDLDVFLEKPVAPTVPEVDALLEARSRSQRRCQVGYQAQATRGLALLRALIEEGALGEVQSVGGAGRWRRGTRYWQRSAWAGRLCLGGRPVGDGVFANPLSHMVQLALAVAGAATAETGARPATVQAELARANDIECDDTAFLRVETVGGPTLSLAATLCAEEVVEPLLVVRGTRGVAEFRWQEDVLWWHPHGNEPSTRTGLPAAEQRVALLADLLLPTQRSVPHSDLLAPVEVGRDAVAVVDASLASVGLPSPAPSVGFAPAGDGSEGPVIPGINQLVERAAREGASFCEQGAKWAVLGERVSAHSVRPACQGDASS